MEGEAGERSQSMLVAQMLLCAGFLIFIIYPATIPHVPTALTEPSKHNQRKGNTNRLTSRAATPRSIHERLPTRPDRASPFRWTGSGRVRRRVGGDLDDRGDHRGGRRIRVVDRAQEKANTVRPASAERLVRRTAAERAAGAMKRGGVRRRETPSGKPGSGVSAIEFVFLTPILFFLISPRSSSRSTSSPGTSRLPPRRRAPASLGRGGQSHRALVGRRPGKGGHQEQPVGTQPAGQQLRQRQRRDDHVRKHRLAGVRGADGWTVYVTVTPKVPSLIPGVQMTVTETSTGPVEQFIPDR